MNVEILTLIPLSKQHPNEIPIVVFKPTGFGSIDIFEKVGLNLPMIEQEKQKWENIKNRIEEVCQSAHDHGVHIMADAEHSWMQDESDNWMDEMMKKVKKERY